MRSALAIVACLALSLPRVSAAQSRLTTHGFSAVFPGPVSFTRALNGKSEHWDCATNNAVISVSYEEKKLNGKDPFADLETLSRDTLSYKAQLRRLRIDGHPAVLSTFLMDDVTVKEVTVNSFITVRLLLVRRNSEGYYRVKITSCDKASNRSAESFLKSFHLVT
jgi:hypothetical protein